MSKKRAGKAKVIPDGSKFRVVEADGTPCGSERAPSDGGGFDDERAANSLAARINERRKAARS